MPPLGNLAGRPGRLSRTADDPSTHAVHAQIEERHWWFLARRRIVLALAREVLPPSRSATVLDIGCGTGANTAALSADYACSGFDVSKEAVSLARTRFPDMHFVEGAPSHHTVRNSNLLLLLDVLEHLDEDQVFLAGLVGAASPGAQLLITVPADPSLWSPHDLAFGHRRRYEPEDLRRLFGNLPVELRLLSHFNIRLYPFIKAVRSWARWRGGTRGVQGTDFRMPPAWANRLLTAVFAGEARRLLAALDGGIPAYRRGASLVAILRKREGNAP